MQIHQIYTESAFRNFTYLLECDNGDLYCIDPFSASQVLERVKKVNGKLKAIINTHEHFDHIQGNDKLIAETYCQLWGPGLCRSSIPNLERGILDKELITLDENHVLEVVCTPGHTLSALCLLLKKNNKVLAIFTGDTLFAGGVGNCHNGGDPQKLFETISLLSTNLDDDVVVYPGHDYLGTNMRFTLNITPNNKDAQELLARYLSRNSGEFILTDMKTERAVNLFLRLHDKELKQTLLEREIISVKSSDENVFIKLRKLRDKW